MNKFLSVLAIVCLLQSCMAQKGEEKINGISFVANRNPVDSTHVQPLLEVNANYAAVMPFGFVPALDKQQIIYNTDKQWYGETREGGRNYVNELHKKNIKVMLKPQIWIRHGEFTGYLKMETEEEWLALETSYRNFIMDYATLAQEENAEIFCIGTELEQFVVNRPDFWSRLIKEIKEVYKGKLTYAANWDEYKRTPFWEQLDFLGIDDYFPVCEDQTPTLECAIAGWTKCKEEVSAFAKAANRKVIFTEYGYRSVDYTGKEPWKADRSMTEVNLAGQVNTTKALYEAVWNEEWMAGGFIWKWFINHEKSGGLENNQFTPQNKPVEAVIKEYYGKE